jgi:hypothetical protein
MLADMEPRKVVPPGYFVEPLEVEHSRVLYYSHLVRS